MSDDPKVPARCEQCHRVVWTRASLVKNPDWWFCPECRGIEGKADRVGEYNVWWD